MAVKEDRIYVVGELDSPLEGAEDPCANIWIGAYETCKGRLVWERTFNPGSCENTVRGMALNPNSGTIYVTGFYMEEDGDYRDNNKVFVRKFRGDGTPDRFGRNVQLVYPETEEYFKSYKALDIAIGSDGGILVAGQYRDDFYGRNVWVAKADSSGSWRWTERSSRYLKTGIIYGIAVDESNNPVVAGATWENVFAPLIRPSIWMGKLQASNGELLSEYIQPPARDTDYHIHSIGDPDHYDYSGSAIAVHDSLIALVGFRPLSSGSDYSDYKASWIGLFENSPTEPEMLWNDTHMPVKGDESCAEDVVFSSSGDMFVVGNVGPYADADADNKIWIKKYAPASGREVPTWEKRFDNLSSRRVMSVAVGTDDEGQVYILGDTGFFQRMCGDNTSLPYAYTTRTYHSDDKAIIIKSPSE